MPADLVTAIAQVVQERRSALGMTRVDVDRRAGHSRCVTSNLERGVGKRGGTVESLLGIAGALGLRPSELLAMAEARVASERKAA